MRSATVLVTVSVLAFAAWPSVRAQAPTGDTKPPAFEVASVKPNPDTAKGARRGFMRPEGRFIILNQTLRTIILMAYEVGDDRLADAPGWTADEDFDINAKLPDGATQDQSLPMLRTLLTERFQLAAHHERRRASTFVLRRAGAGNQLGPDLRRPSTPCLRRPPASSPNASATDGQSVCGVKTGPGRFTAIGMPLTALCDSLSRQLGETVVNETGLEGPFDVDLNFALESVLPPLPDGASNRPRPPASEYPALTVAIQRQLGLRLDHETSLQDFLVIDHIERPTDN